MKDDSSLSGRITMKPGRPTMGVEETKFNGAGGCPAYSFRLLIINLGA